LQVAEDASTEDIKAAYRRLALEHHPDRVDDPQATERMQRINEAYATLVDPAKREQYDLERAIQFNEALEAFDGDPVEEEGPHRTQEIIVREVHFEKQQTWARSQLKIIFRIFLLTSALFLWAIVSGQVNFAALILLVVISLQIIVSVMMRIRNLSAPGSADHK
jgi:curved DNA-binding protein CbpA